jgi:hypothetical protein
MQILKYWKVIHTIWHWNTIFLWYTRSWSSWCKIWDSHGVSNQSSVVRNVTSCSMADLHQCFRSMYSNHLQSWRGNLLALLFNPEDGTVHSSKTSVKQTTWHNITEDVVHLVLIELLKIFSKHFNQNHWHLANCTAFSVIHCIATD